MYGRLKLVSNCNAYWFKSDLSRVPIFMYEYCGNNGSLPGTFEAIYMYVKSYLNMFIHEIRGKSYIILSPSEYKRYTAK